MAPGLDLSPHRAVHLLHLAMGIAMVAEVSGIRPGAWSVAAATGFALSAAWFGARTVLPHTRLADLQHAAASLAMVAMVAAMAPAGAGGRAPNLVGVGASADQMAGHPMTSSALDPHGVLLRLLVAVTVLCVLADIARQIRRNRPFARLTSADATGPGSTRSVLAADLAMAFVMGMMVLG